MANKKSSKKASLRSSYTNENFDFMSGIVKRFDDLKYALLDAQTFDAKHFGFPDFYYEIMETDQVRVDAYRSAFKKYNNLKGKVVCEVGVGTLALTQHFLPHVKKAYLIESKIFKHMRQFLKKNGKLMPGRIVNVAQLANAKFEKRHTHYPIFFTRHLPEVLSLQQPINTIDLYKEQEEHIIKRTVYKPHLSGEVNCVYLHSWIEVAEGCNFTGTDSLMPPTVVKLKKPVKVKAGTTYELTSDYHYGTSLKKAQFSLKKKK